MFAISFRKKILISFLLFFLLFLALLVPFSTREVKRIVIKTMQEQTTNLIKDIHSAHAEDNTALVAYLRVHRPVLFRIAIITDEHKMLYDSRTRRLLGDEFDKEYVVQHPEVLQAFKEGEGFHEDYSKLLDMRFAYFAKTFDFNGKTYVLRAAFPSDFIDNITHSFQIGFIQLSFIALLIFSIMLWFIFNKLSQPINQIITAVRPYQEGSAEHLPTIPLSSVNPSDDFGRLAITLNSLSKRVEGHISTLMRERNEKVAILESLMEGVIAVDEQLRITYINSMAEKFLGKSKKDLIGQPASSIEQPIMITLLSECFADNMIKTGAMQFKLNGEHLHLTLVAVPTKENNDAILVLQDQSVHYKMLEMRKDFIANASHELKTPITIIRGFAEALHDTPDLPVQRREEITEKIVRSCQHMTVLVKDLLILSDIEHLPSSRIVDCDLGDLVDYCRTMLLEIHPDAEVIIERSQEEEIHCDGDPDFIELALMNLMENAAKYSTGPAHITVSLQLEGEWIRIKVADKGIGIPENDLEHIFQRFYTVDKAHSRMMGGSGLGLSIVETIVDKHRGKISVASTYGVGTTFTILLPVKHALKHE